MTWLDLSPAFCSLFSICVSSPLFLFSWLLGGWVYLWPCLPVGYSLPFPFSLIFGARFRGSISSLARCSPSWYRASSCVIHEFHFLSHFSYCFQMFYFQVLCTRQGTVPGFLWVICYLSEGWLSGEESSTHTFISIISSILPFSVGISFPPDGVSSAWRTALNILL